MANQGIRGFYQLTETINKIQNRFPSERGSILNLLEDDLKNRKVW